MREHKQLLPAWVTGEFVGTFLLVFFGCGSVAAAVLTGAQVGVFQVAIVWGLGIATAIYLTGSLSGAHLNPAVTLSLAAANGFPWRRVPGYVAVQGLGAFCASGALYAAFAEPLRTFETAHGIIRGAPGSEASARIFGEYFSAVSPATAFFIEALATGILVLVILCSIHPGNSSRPGILTPAAIGLTVTVLISLFGPLTMAGLNPARDFAPRVFSALAGWGKVPFTTNGSGWLTVYILAPIVGGQLAGIFYRFCLKPHYSALRSPPA